MNNINNNDDNYRKVCHNIALYLTALILSKWHNYSRRIMIQLDFKPLNENSYRMQIMGLLL